MSRRAMGTEFQVVLWGGDRTHLQAAAEDALDEVERLDQQLSIYLDASDVSWVNRHAAHEPVRIESGLFALLETAAQVNRQTNGAFDLTIRPIMDCWKRARARGRPPSRDSIVEALRRVGMRHVALDRQHKTVAFDREGVSLDLGGIAKGYAVERAAEMLRRFGVAGALIHGGYSTIYALGGPPDAEAWTVGIQDPYEPSRRLTTVQLRHEALSTSGNYDKFFEMKGRLYSHIFDPRTGQPAEGLLSASVIARSPTEADALSTAFFVLGMEGTRRYCAKHSGVRAILVPVPAPGNRPRPTFIGAEP